MLEEAEQYVAELEAALADPPDRGKVVYLPGVVEACLRDPKGTVDTDPAYARRRTQNCPRLPSSRPLGKTVVEVKRRLHLDVIRSDQATPRVSISPSEEGKIMAAA